PKKNIGRPRAREVAARHARLAVELARAKNLSQRVVRALESKHNELWLSPISTWELLMLVERNRVSLKMDVNEWVANAMDTVPLREAPITHEVALETQRVGLMHRDPTDRFLAATAKVFELTLVTADKRMIAVKGLPTLANR
ncbi:MAG: type II toxin-antitoxin system VapC family toxin, partial [Gammaproteobacteria bacterium]|nr:type II toxin-antitoxin system VapC family toxin [Gammaproteobacteria bacterium]